jgi:hypothetical protein
MSRTHVPVGPSDCPPNVWALVGKLIQLTHADIGFHLAVTASTHEMADLLEYLRGEHLEKEMKTPLPLSSFCLAYLNDTHYTRRPRGRHT